MDPTVREGVTAGILAATAVALWFFVVDLILGRPFGTPELLGRGLFGLLEDGLGPLERTLTVFGYTIFHYLVFVAIGLVVAHIVKRAKEVPSILAGALILFVMLEVGFQSLLVIFGSIPVFGVLAWYNVAVGNLIAAATMGIYIWRAHPELSSELAHALGEEPRDEPLGVREER